jgi:hypothetical protein
VSSGQRDRAALACLVLLLGSKCATVPVPPRADVAARAREATSYSARLRVSLKGPGLRARTPALVAFRRPDGLRIEVPGPAGPRLVAVARGGRLVAVFPGERVVYAGEARASQLEALLGVALEPAEVMDLLVGVPSPRLRRYVAAWGPALPRRIEATLPDGGRLKVTVEDPETGRVLLDAAFAEPPHEGYRSVDAEEARSLWSGR